MSGIVEWYKDAMHNKSHPLTKDWFLVSGLGPMVMIIATYVYFCLFAGPRYMKDKKPYELRTTLIVYNFIQVLLSIYLFYEGLMSGWLYEYNYRCQPVDYSNNPLSIRMANGVHFYMMCKLIEMLDTVFFVLRKKDRQISVLHLYHHALMPLCAWVGIKFVPNGHLTFLGVINAFVHIIMYGYYMLASIGPHMNKYLWWKKYITMLQLVQFVLIAIHTSQLFFNGCNFPLLLATLLMINTLWFIYLFSAFYVNTYKQDKKKRKTIATADKTE